MQSNVITIIGRMNVGKSTLFNKLTKTNDALVNKFEGLTRDRKYGNIIVKGEKYYFIDTAGIKSSTKKIEKKILQQTIVAIQEASLILFVVNSKEGLIAEDQEVANMIRIYQKKTILLVNKYNQINSNIAKIEFYVLGFKNIHALSVLKKEDVHILLNQHIIPSLKKETNQDIKKININSIKKIKNVISNKNTIKIAVIGKPNVGKSTLINGLINQNRLITHNQPGTTRETIKIPMENFNNSLTFFDTAGIHKPKNNLDKIIQNDTLNYVKETDIVLLVINAYENITHQDLTLCNTIIKMGRSIIIIINKYDLLNKQEKNQLKKNTHYILRFIKFYKIHFISAIHKFGIKKIFKSIQDTYQSNTKKFNTSELTIILKKAIKKNDTPFINGSRIKLQYAHSGGYSPLIIVIHGKKTKYLTLSYIKYLKNYYQNELKLIGSCIKLHFKDTKNPYIK
ncbi:ribosome biogenesis GTPase Der [Buchnera aphidicola (Formosaphis micheliae)]|uniref:ribosome biogenesis GTPase Der n=1 Tax=Buchnera aphidicola TaxID=9 RepID=UPI0031CC5AFB